MNPLIAPPHATRAASHYLHVLVLIPTGFRPPALAPPHATRAASHYLHALVLIPTGFRPPAQGCRRGNPGNRTNNGQPNPIGVMSEAAVIPKSEMRPNTRSACDRYCRLDLSSPGGTAKTLRISQSV